MNKRYLLKLPFYNNVAGPLPVAHQGADLVGVDKQNTMLAFEAAVAAGFQYIETDTVASADNVAMAVHGADSQKQVDDLIKERQLVDPDAVSVWPVRSQLESMTYAEILADPRFLIGGEPIPRLDEVLSSFPDTKFFIDAKTGHSVSPLAKVVKSQHAERRVSIGAFDARRTKAVIEQIGSRERIAASAGIIGTLAMLGYAKSIPFAGWIAANTFATQLAPPHRFKFPVLGERQVVDSTFVDRAHELGLRVIPWTPNDRDDIAFVLAAGADGVISDNAKDVLELTRKFTT